MKVQDYITGVQHIGIPTKDFAETLCFYESLGFEKKLQTRNGASEVAFLQLQNLMIETYEDEKAVGTPGAIDHIAIDVTDIEGAYKTVSALGYPSLEGAIQSLPFWEHGVSFFTIAGPNGEKVEFSQRL